MKNETFGTRFARLRKEKNLTQDDIAAHVGLSPQAVSKWENDISSPDISLLLELSKLLGVSVETLLGETNESKVTLLPDAEKGDTDNYSFKITVESKQANVKLNLPVALIKALFNSGFQLSNLVNVANSDDILSGIDFGALVELAEKGVLGNIVEVDADDGTKVRIFVEK